MRFFLSKIIVVPTNIQHEAGMFETFIKQDLRSFIGGGVFICDMKNHIATRQRYMHNDLPVRTGRWSDRVLEISGLLE